MFKINKSVEIVTSTIKSLSSMSLQSRLEAKAVLERKYKQVRITDVRSVSDLDMVMARKPDLAFLGMKFVMDDSGSESKPVWLSERLAEAGIPFTGSDMIASALEHNKLLAKRRVSEHGLMTASSMLIKQGESYSQDDITIPYPIFVKPVDGGGGSGVNDHSLVRNFDELKAQVAWLLGKLQTDALLESYLPGREFSVGVLKKRFSDSFHLLPLEIVAPVNQTGSRFLSSQVKRTDTERTFEVTDHQIRLKINNLALEAFRALGAQDYGRIDIRLDSEGTPHFLEANLLPSLLNNYGNLPKAALLNIGLTHEELVMKIAELGLSKKPILAASSLSREADDILHGLSLQSS